MSFKTTLLKLDGTEQKITVTDINIMKNSSAWAIIYEVGDEELKNGLSHAVFSDNKFIETKSCVNPFPNDDNHPDPFSNFHRFNQSGYHGLGIIKIKLSERFVKNQGENIENIRKFCEEIKKSFHIPRGIAVFNITQIKENFYIEIDGDQAAKIIEICSRIFTDANIDKESFMPSLMHAFSVGSAKELIKDLINNSRNIRNIYFNM